MKTTLAVVVSIFLVVGVALAMAGCVGQSAADAPAASGSAGAPAPSGGEGGKTPALGSLLRDIGSAPGSAVLMEKLGPFFNIGVVYIVLAGLTAAFGLWKRALCLAAAGVGAVVVGVVFGEYPWMALVVFVPAAVFIGIQVVASWRDHKVIDAKSGELGKLESVTEVLAESIEKSEGGPAVKETITSLGPEKVSLLKPIIGAVKTRLREAGKIG